MPKLLENTKQRINDLVDRWSRSTLNRLPDNHKITFDDGTVRRTLELKTEEPQETRSVGGREVRQHFKHKHLDDTQEVSRAEDGRANYEADPRPLHNASFDFIPNYELVSREHETQYPAEHTELRPGPMQFRTQPRYGAEGNAINKYGYDSLALLAAAKGFERAARAHDQELAQDDRLRITRHLIPTLTYFTQAVGSVVNKFGGLRHFRIEDIAITPLNLLEFAKLRAQLNELSRYYRRDSQEELPCAMRNLIPETGKTRQITAFGEEYGVQNYFGTLGFKKPKRAALGINWKGNFVVIQEKLNCPGGVRESISLKTAKSPLNLIRIFSTMAPDLRRVLTNPECDEVHGG